MIKVKILTNQINAYANYFQLYRQFSCFNVISKKNNIYLNN